jgi:hypothetical protein
MCTEVGRTETNRSAVPAIEGGEELIHRAEKECVCCEIRFGVQFRVTISLICNLGRERFFFLMEKGALGLDSCSIFI